MVVSTDTQSLKHNATIRAGTTESRSDIDASLLAEPRSLRRSINSAAINIASDLLSVVAWSGMLVYAALLWYYRERPFSAIPFPAERLISGA